MEDHVVMMWRHREMNLTWQKIKHTRRNVNNIINKWGSSKYGELCEKSLTKEVNNNNIVLSCTIALLF